MQEDIFIKTAFDEQFFFFLRALQIPQVKWQNHLIFEIISCLRSGFWESGKSWISFNTW